METKPINSRYDAITRKKLRKLIRQKLNEGKTYEEIAVSADQMGFTTPRGEKITWKTMRQQGYLMGIRFRGKRKTKSVRAVRPARGPVSHIESVTAALLKSNLSNETLGRVIRELSR